MRLRTTCFNCAVWDGIVIPENPDDASYVGFCRAESPRAVDDYGFVMWPKTRHDDWCLKFISRQALKRGSTPPLLVITALNLVVASQASDLILG